MDYRKLAVPILALVILAFLPNHVHADNQLFFDDFTTSNLSPNWTFGGANVGNVSQYGGYLTMTITGAAINNNICNGNAACISVNAIANNTAELINSQTPNNQFFEMVVRLQPFNMTSPGNLGIPSNKIRNAELDVGLRMLTSSNWIGARFIETDLASNTNITGGSLDGHKQTVAFLSSQPGSSNCTSFDQGAEGALRFGGSCSTKKTSPVYSDVIDLNQVHTLIFRMRVAQWFAMAIDDNAFMNFTAAACGCFGPPFAVPLFPAFLFSYCIGTKLNACVTTTPSQSLSTSIDYVAIYDYVPASLPTGQILFSNIRPPTSLTQPFTLGGGETLPAMIQFYANEWGQGNIYAGGELLMATIMLIISVTLGLVTLRKKLSISIATWMWNLLAVATSFFFYICGVIPLLIPVLAVIAVIATTFGIIRTGVPGVGGEVPD